MYRIIIKMLVSCIFWMMYYVTRKERYQFMLHYLIGNGRAQVAGRIKECFNKEFWASKIAKDAIYGYRPVHSTDYDHYGFYGRPELFYCVGGFGYDYIVKSDTIVIFAADRYDWHPSVVDGTPFYFGSPLPISLEWDKWESYCWTINSLLGAIILQESFDGTVAISNLFWEWLGGREFTTYMRWEFDIKEFDKLYYYH